MYILLHQRNCISIYMYVFHCDHDVYMHITVPEYKGKLRFGNQKNE